MKLGSWLADLRVKFPNYDSFGIDGHVDASEKGGKALAKARAETVARFLTDRGFLVNRVRVEEPGRSFNVPIAGLPTRAVAIEFMPACPHDCCAAATGKAEDTGQPMPDGPLR